MITACSMLGHEVTLPGSQQAYKEAFVLPIIAKESHTRLPLHVLFATVTVSSCKEAFSMPQATSSDWRVLRWIPDTNTDSSAVGMLPACPA